MPEYGNKKDELIQTLSALPSGLQNFLTIGIPTAPTISLPSDVDAAIIANGIASKYVLDLFNAYAGLFLAALPLHVGQENDWLRAGVLSGLESGSLNGADDDDDETGNLVIVEPSSGAAYKPGDLRVQVKGKNAVLQSASATIEGKMGQLSAGQGCFWGIVCIPEDGEYTMDVLGSFEGDGPIQSASVSFSIDEEADNEPDGDDLKALDTAIGVVKDAARQLLSAASDAARNAAIPLLEAAANKVLNVGKGVVDRLPNSLQQLYDRIRGNLNRLLGSRGLVIEDDLLEIIGDVQADLNTYCAAIVAEWEREHPHPSSGYAYSPQALRGAARAMNAKYGPGTVTWA